MSRTPFGTAFRRTTERFPDQTRPDQSFLEVLGGCWTTQSQIVKAVTREAASVGFGAMQ